MSSREDLAMSRARRAYEWGRVRLGLRRALWVLPLVVASWWWRGQLGAAMATGAGLAALVVLFVWRGGGLARAVAPGLVAGAAPLLLPLWFATLRGAHLCSRCGWESGDFRACLAACVVGGAVGGLALGLGLARIGRGRGEAAVGAVALAMLAGTLGCTLVGAWGLAGMTAGMMVLGAPALVLAARAR
jgi:hypothetical protein